MHEPKDKFAKKRLNSLANLIADSILDIKIAFTESNSLMGMYHEKLGIIPDIEGNSVVFSGSMNESANALTANYEVHIVDMSKQLERGKGDEFARAVQILRKDMLMYAVVRMTTNKFLRKATALANNLRFMR